MTISPDDLKKDGFGTILQKIDSGGVPTTRSITAGAGLTGGGDLSADRTLNVVANADGSIVVNTDNLQVGTLANDTQHGTRGGGTLHTQVTTSNDGFMSAVDKTKLDGVASGATATPLTSTVPVNVTKGTAVIGLSGEAARQDHKHNISTGIAGTITPGDTALEGSASSLALSDHRHSIASFAIPVSIGVANSEGSQANFSRSDHIHAPNSSATSSLGLSSGTRSVIIYTVPVSPTGGGRFVLTRCIVRLAVSLVGSGSALVSIGSTSGGTQIITPVNVTSVTVTGVIAGEAVGSLGTDMVLINAYEAVYSANQNIYANITVSGSVIGGRVDIYLYGLSLAT